MSVPVPEPAWCFTCHPDGDEWHDDECCCGMKTRTSSDDKGGDES